jgi:hypothetical protein
MPNLRGRHLESATPVTAASTSVAPHGASAIVLELASAGAQDDVALLLDSAFQIGWVLASKLSAAGAGGDNVQVRCLSGAITDALAGGGAVGLLRYPATLSDFYTTLPKGDILIIRRGSSAPGADNSWRVVIIGFHG